MSSVQNTTNKILNKKNFINLVKLLVMVLIVLGVNRGVQSYLGEAAYDSTGLGNLSYNAALEQAKSSNRLVLADMSAIWCPTCRKLDKEVLSNSKVQEVINQNYVFTRIEYESDEGEAFMQRYDVNGFPTLLVLNQVGDKLVQLPLTFDPEKFKDLLNQATNQFNK
ncbi:thioredoxin family protein [Paraglaciecola sp. L3A3]|uniref:thioredoxin family protein n=1 Tax=Paraglaciecola sp. L3A3 TaxID=2686358 RepID=UPI001E497D12|nr:thioredoxin family protein [Paraglaciecola sp. L3A3]